MRAFVNWPVPPEADVWSISAVRPIATSPPGYQLVLTVFYCAELHFLALDLRESICRPRRTITGQNRDYAQWIAIIGILRYQFSMGRIEPGMDAWVRE
jgi:hypothetical protein